MTLEDGDILKMQDIAHKATKHCAIGVELKKEVEHVNKALQSLENVDDRIFDKMDGQSKETGTQFTQVNNKIAANEEKESGRFITILVSLLVSAMGFIGAFLLFYFKLSAKL